MVKRPGSKRAGTAKGPARRAVPRAGSPGNSRPGNSRNGANDNRASGRIAQPRRRGKRRKPAKSLRPQRPLWRRAVKGAVYWGAVASVWALVVVAGIFAYYAAGLPQISDLQVPKRAPNVVIVDVSGAVMASRGIGHGQDIRYEQLPDYLPQAVIAIEDRRFRSHYGIDVIGLARATLRNLWAGHIVEGGSTLTQQLAKNLFLKPDRTIRRKIQEMILALWLEANYSKDEILELYLNRVYFGAGTYGVEAASRRYFGKSARHVNLAEATILAGLLKAPTRYAPTNNPDGADERSRLVLINMVEEGYVTESQSRNAQAHRAVLMHGSNAGAANYIADWVSDILPGFINQPDTDITVVTTIDLDLQAAAEIALRQVLDAEGAEYNASQGALVALDTNGQVRALIGGRSYAESQFNRAVNALRQPGSAFKPFVFLAALEGGLTADTIRSDSPIRIGTWAPKNYTDEFKGDISLRYALSHSVNTVAVRLIREVGPKAVARIARRMGIQSTLHNNASLALGTAEVSLFELTAAYTPFANGGFGVLPHIISEVRNGDGDILYRVEGAGPGRVISPLHTAMMNDMMQAAITSGTGRRAAFNWPAAGKTGTSQDFRDAWFLGYTADFVAGVWVGNDDGTPTNRVTGGNLPAKIWRQFMVAAHEGRQVRPLNGFQSIPLPQLRVNPGAADQGIYAQDPSAPVGRDRQQSSSQPVVPSVALGEETGPGPAPVDEGFLQRIFGGKT
ncbi:MAG: penicillin-binding protein 1A [Fimbriimonadaceae bacterium]|nr:penicillin-binding protein 1A [Alphaproteobacteria bacterium]